MSEGPGILSPEILLVPTGLANLASVAAGLSRAGGRPRVAERAEELEGARFVVLPGVGAFGPGAAFLAEGGWAERLRAHWEARRPLLAVCLGMQLLFEESEESPGARGLGLLPGRVGRFAGVARVPQMGWNDVAPAPGSRLLEAGHAYFANSFRVNEMPDGVRAARADYGGPFLAAFEEGPRLGCQFHPELSGAWGLALLRRFVERGLEEAGAC